MKSLASRWWLFLIGLFLAAALVVGTLFIRPIQPELPPELAFLHEMDPNPTLTDFGHTSYGPGLSNQVVHPTLRFAANGDALAIARRLKQLDGWTVTFPQVGSYHAECHKGPLHLQFFANYGESNFFRFRDERVSQPDWKVRLRSFIKRE